MAVDLGKIRLDFIQKKTVAILGYGNQGRAHALNLRDSGVKVIVGARRGKGATQAKKDGFKVLSFEAAVRNSVVVMFLLPDEVIASVYLPLAPLLGGKTVGFAHGSALHFGWIKKIKNCDYFLAGPKGAGSILRKSFEDGKGLPGVYAVSHEKKELRNLAESYCKAIGIANQILLKTSFQEETECDLFGEQVVLCGGLPQLMEKAFNTLIKNGLSPEMAFFETCFEARLILELWLKNGPAGMTEKISPTAFFGGLTRGQRVVDKKMDRVLEKIFKEIRSGSFANEWQNEVKSGKKLLKAETKRLKKTKLQKTYDQLKHVF